MTPTRLVVGFSDGMGVGMGIRLLQLLARLPVETHLIVLDGAKQAISDEGALEVLQLADFTYRQQNQAARISSGSFVTAGMVVVACSPTSLARIATGYASNLLYRAADVTMKEARPLVLLGQDLGVGLTEGAFTARLMSTPKVAVISVAEDLTISEPATDGMLLSVLDAFGMSS
jgi:polyprenyl P-hydroxybenzoate/phenylacrylic acid decarboxylase-like protein